MDIDKAKKISEYIKYIEQIDDILSYNNKMHDNMRFLCQIDNGVYLEDNVREELINSLVKQAKEVLNKRKKELLKKIQEL